ncbi:MAG: alpha-glucosidase C-terminal domain-containing protein [Nocardioidaceae bacterium]
MRHGDITFLPATPAVSVIAYERRTTNDHKVIALNLNGAPATVDLPSRGVVLISTTGDPRSTSATLQLAPNEAVVIDVEEGGRNHEDH